MKPLAIVATHPIQYQAPLFRYLTANGIPLHVFYLNDQGLRESHDVGFGRTLAWDIPLLDGYEYSFLSNLHSRPRAETFMGLVNLGVLKHISARRFSAVLIQGYRSLSMCLTFGASWLRRLPVLYRSESNLQLGGALGVKRQLGRMLLRTRTRCLAIGTLNDAFYGAVGVPQSRRFLVPYAVDNQRFSEEAAALTKDASRRELGLPTTATVILYAGKLVSWKQPDLLLRAFARVRTPDAHLLIVGTGALDVHLRQLAQELAPGRVHLIGFLNQGEVGRAYRAADLLVLPSLHEPWGLVVNEAMNFAVPCLVSDLVGCGPDLISPSETGEIFRAGNLTSLCEKLAPLIADRARLARMGANAQLRISRWGFPECEIGLRAALEDVQHSPLRRGIAVDALE